MSYRLAKRKRKAQANNPINSKVKRQRTNDSIDSIGKESSTRPATVLASLENRSDSSSGSSEDNDDLDCFDADEERPRDDLLTDEERKDLGTYVLHRFKKFCILNEKQINNYYANRILKVFNLTNTGEFQL